MGEILAAVVSGMIGLGFLLTRQMTKYHMDQVDAGLETVARLEAQSPLLQAYSTTPRTVEVEDGIRSSSRPDDKAVLERMQAINHRARLNFTRDEAVEAGLFRLARIVGLYHAYLGTDQYWKRGWWKGNPVLNGGELLQFERTMRRVLEDTKARLRGEKPRGGYEAYPRDLTGYPLFQARIRVLGVALRTPKTRWALPAAPLDEHPFENRA